MTLFKPEDSGQRIPKALSHYFLATIAWCLLLPTLLAVCFVCIFFDRLAKRLEPLMPMTDRLLQAMYSYPAAAGLLIVADIFPAYIWTREGDSRLWFVWLLILMQAIISAFVRLLINELGGLEIASPRRNNDLEWCLKAMTSSAERKTV